MTAITRYAFSRAAIARPVPVLPEVGSMIVPPGLSRPSRSAASISRTATLSLIEPPGLNSSSLATIWGLTAGAIRDRRTSGVPPIVSRIDSLMSAWEATVSRAGDWAMVRPTVRTEVMRVGRSWAADAPAVHDLTRRAVLVHDGQPRGRVGALAHPHRRRGPTVPADACV